ncbi:MAG: PilZ domain-containing protein [Myxococcaceae bacterium]|nr:PilZ domain-containing protein [Myxococcaceae bacterium]
MASEKKKVDDTTLPLLTPKLPRMKDRRGGSDSLSKLVQRIQTGAPERRAFRDRRATPRVAVALDLEAGDGGQAVMMRTHDLSTFGVGVASGPTPKKGSRITIRLFLPDDPTTPLELKVVVIGAFGEHGGARMKFLNPPVEAVRRIHRLLG